MKERLQLINALLFVVFFIACSGCKEFLDAKPDRKLVVPKSLSDLQAILDYNTVMNEKDLAAGEASADNYYLTKDDWEALSSDNYKRMYIWDKENLFSTMDNPEWASAYKPVYSANTCLENLKKIKPTNVNRQELDNVKGQALFHRAKSFFTVAQIWCVTYDENTSGNELGIPLRISTDFNQQSHRSTLEESYRQIIGDLKESVPLLPASPIHVVRPSMSAAYAILARVYLSMGLYDKAKLYADSCLALKNDLLDFNTLNAGDSYPIDQINKEVIFESRATMPSSLSNSRAKIDTVLYNSYTDNDLRKSIFFKVNDDRTIAFHGSYEGSGNLFFGIATDEVYLIRAECLARKGLFQEALKDMSALMRNRFKSGTFTGFGSIKDSEVLGLILEERRKELLMRGLRWTDIKRLNREGRNIYLERRLGTDHYILPPNDPRYALPIPEEVVEMAGMAQNPR